MKVKVVCILLFISTSTFSQLKVDNLGHIGMGTNYPSPWYMCHIKGNLLLTTYPAIPFREMQLKVGNGWPGAEIGSSADILAIWSSGLGYNKVYAENFVKSSDSTLKFDVGSINNPLNLIVALKPHKYKFQNKFVSEIGDTIIEYIPQYGFISQEVERVFTDVKITHDSKGIKLMDYDMIIPVLTAGLQEQQKLIESLQSMTAIMMATNTNYSSEPVEGLPEASRLIGSTPNPFSSSTTLECKLVQGYSTASIKVFDMQGTMRKSLIIQPTIGNWSVVLNGDELPIKGTYVYGLFVNGGIVDAKTVIFE